ncbi:hypothetical protein CAPN010_03650 [Capnocytophaga cynodegmi]|uniref:protein rep n=1 Tax=Capnocytophaga cynodegmi TaxID=28189 RepID=UPI001EE34912|nr:protein rep [Capnocytophaga cynodegmi]GJQ06207.1 hypothetical protein CAPN010_03650 [Capnocytophaga cynodegmi]
MCLRKNFDELFIIPENLKSVRVLPNKFAKIQHFTASLDTNIKFVRNQTQSTRIEFEKMRRYSGSLLIDQKDFERGYNTTCTCGVKRLNGDNDKTPVAVVQGQKSQKIFFNGLMKCGSVWRCPVCGFKITKHRQDEIYYMSSEWLRQGYEISFITLTMRHRSTFKLVKSLDILLGEFRKLQNTKVYKGIETDHNIMGFVRTLEITYGSDNGWHPHLHLLVFHKSKNADDLHKRFIKAWCKRKAVGALQKNQRAKLVYNKKGVTEYVTKWDMTKEMTQSSFKETKGNQRYTPFSMLRDLANDSFTKDSQGDFLRGFLHWKYIEYCKATKGRHFITISKKMKAFFKEVSGQEIKTEEEILQDEKIDNILFKMDSDLWDDVAKNRQIFPSYILNAYENGSIENVLHFFKSAGYLVAFDSSKNLIFPIDNENLKETIPEHTIVYVRECDNSEWKIRRFKNFGRRESVQVYSSQYDFNCTSTEFYPQYSFINPFN